VKENLQAWLKFLSLEFSASKFGTLLQHFGSPEAVLEASENELKEVAGIRPVDIVAIETAARKEMPVPPVLERGEIQLLTWDDPDYPIVLRDLPDPPVALFVKGEIEERDRFGIGIVGTRQATAYGRMVTERLAHDLSDAGVTIISGGAAGIDTVAHRTAVHLEARTIAVLGSGLNTPYPPQNRVLFDQIAKNGAVVSEFLPDSPPDPWRFPVRNRLIAALGMAVLVVEAPEASGALITARLATEIGRDVFAVPGSIDNLQVKGCHQLIKDGAGLVESAQDILDALGVQRSPQKQTALPVLTEPQEQLLQALSLQPKYLDNLARETRMPVHLVQVELTNLELMGLARRMPGGTFVRVL
jgi:DNA processing protein